MPPLVDQDVTVIIVQLCNHSWDKLDEYADYNLVMDMFAIAVDNVDTCIIHNWSYIWALYNHIFLVTYV